LSGVSALGDKILVGLIERQRARNEAEICEYQTKAMETIATLAFREFRHKNGLVLHYFQKSCIKDFKSMVLEALKNHSASVKYTQELRQKLVQAIGLKRAEPLTISQEDVEKSIAQLGV
jgi:hypothetical protein